MRGSFGAVRKTSLAFDLLEKYLTYPRLLRQFIQEVSLLFLEVTKARTGGHIATRTPACSSGRGAFGTAPQ